MVLNLRGGIQGARAEIVRADAAYRQWWLSVLTAGIIPRPEPEPELEAEAM